EEQRGRGCPSGQRDDRVRAGEGVQGAPGERRGDAGRVRAARRAGDGPDRALAERRPAGRRARLQARRGAPYHHEDAPAPEQLRPRGAAPRSRRRPQLPGLSDGEGSRPGRSRIPVLGAGRAADVRGPRPIRAAGTRQAADEGAGRAGREHEL
ncbi:MAG: Transcriptional regulator, MarR family, partial [uncultured Rubrobacteraceae bacterium]